ncbi:hypothetical protein [Arthrobacter sp. UYCo732]
MSITVRRALRTAVKTVRRSAPAVVAVLILTGLVGTTLAGALVL